MASSPVVRLQLEIRRANSDDDVVAVDFRRGTKREHVANAVLHADMLVAHSQPKPIHRVVRGQVIVVQKAIDLSATNVNNTGERTECWCQCDARLMTGTKTAIVVIFCSVGRRPLNTWCLL